MATTSEPTSVPCLLGCLNPMDNGCSGVTINCEQSRSNNQSAYSTPPSVDDMELDFTTRIANTSIIGQNQLEQSINAGYTSDDESSDGDGELQESGRTRSSTRRANQVKDKQTEETAPTRATRSSGQPEEGGSGRGKKRKKAGTGRDGSDSEPEDGQDKRRPCVEPIRTEEMVCTCPKDVMTCIGILPSYPIISHFHDSDDSNSSSNDDLTHTVLPTVARNRKGGRGGGGC